MTLIGLAELGSLSLKAGEAPYNRPYNAFISKLFSRTAGEGGPSPSASLRG